MAFPESPRVIYRRNPLAEVICQVRFPPILRIHSEPPAGFQDRIRNQYPLYKESAGQAFALSPNIPAEAARVIQSVAPFRGREKHEFSSADEVWSTTLGRDFLALRTVAYPRWEDFRQRLTLLFDALAAEYLYAAALTGTVPPVARTALPLFMRHLGSLPFRLSQPEPW